MLYEAILAFRKCVNERFRVHFRVILDLHPSKTRTFLSSAREAPFYPFSWERAQKQGILEPFIYHYRYALFVFYMGFGEMEGAPPKKFRFRVGFSGKIPKYPPPRNDHFSAYSRFYAILEVLSR